MDYLKALAIACICMTSAHCKAEDPFLCEEEQLNPNEALVILLAQLEESTGKNILVDTTPELHQLFAGAKPAAHQARDYSVAVTASEKANIGYIVTTLGHSVLAKIATSRSSLKKAGDKINHIHPLRFLMCVFTEEEFKAGFHGIYSRGGRIWNQFFDGLKNSLNEEASRDNMRLEFIQDFAGAVGVDVNQILSSIANQQWNDFIQVLLVQIPRKGNPDRYDM